MSGGVPAGELLPCPFCGDDKPLVGSTLDSGHYVFCSRDACFGGCSYTETRAEAITAWNTRTTPTPPIEGRDADVERVEAVAKAMYDATHAGLSNCYAWDDEWEPHQEAGRGRYYKEAAAAITALQALGERG